MKMHTCRTARIKDVTVMLSITGEMHMRWWSREKKGEKKKRGPGQAFCSLGPWSQFQEKTTVKSMITFQESNSTSTDGHEYLGGEQNISGFHTVLTWESNYPPCLLARGTTSARGVDSGVGNGEVLQTGHVGCNLSHGSTHGRWNMWPQSGSSRSISLPL